MPTAAGQLADRLLGASETLSQYIAERNSSDQPFNEFEIAYTFGLVTVLATAITKTKERRVWKFKFPASARSIREAEYLLAAFYFINAVNIKPWRSARAAKSEAADDA